VRKLVAGVLVGSALGIGVACLTCSGAWLVDGVELGSGSGGVVGGVSQAYVDAGDGTVGAAFAAADTSLSNSLMNAIGSGGTPGGPSHVFYVDGYRLDDVGTPDGSVHRCTR